MHIYFKNSSKVIRFNKYLNVTEIHDSTIQQTKTGKKHIKITKNLLYLYICFHHKYMALKSLKNIE